MNAEYIYVPEKPVLGTFSSLHVPDFAFWSTSSYCLTDSILSVLFFRQCDDEETSPSISYWYNNCFVQISPFGVTLYQQLCRDTLWLFFVAPSCLSACIQSWCMGERTDCLSVRAYTAFQKWDITRNGEDGGETGKGERTPTNEKSSPAPCVGCGTAAYVFRKKFLLYIIRCPIWLSLWQWHLHWWRCWWRCCWHEPWSCPWCRRSCLLWQRPERHRAPSA